MALRLQIVSRHRRSLGEHAIREFGRAGGTIGRSGESDWVLVHGGTSGIGTTAIMLAKAFGAKVITTAGSAEKCEAAKNLGADVAVNYKTDDFVAATKEATGGKGANLIVDIVGGEYIDRNYDAAADQGVIAQVSFTAGPKGTANFGKLMAKRITHTGSTLRPRTVAEKAAIAKGLEERVWPLVVSGKIKPVIDSTYPLAKASDAHARMESSQHIGKIVLTV